jgi:hypothetical protein
MDTNTALTDRYDLISCFESGVPCWFGGWINPKECKRAPPRVIMYFQDQREAYFKLEAQKERMLKKLEERRAKKN